MKIFKSFNIDTNQMHNFRTKEEMQEFLISHMTKHLEENVKYLSDLELQRQNKIKEFYNEFNQKYESKRRSDLCNWLQAKIRNKSLEKHVKQKLFEEMQKESPSCYKNNNYSLLKPNFKKLLVSGGTLQTFIEKTFNDFINLYEKECRIKVNLKQNRPKTARLISSSKYTNNVPSHRSSFKGDKNSAKKQKFTKPKWSEDNEDLFKTHKADIIHRLSNHSSTVPWNDVIIGSFDNIGKNTYYKSIHDKNRKSQVLIDKGLMLDPFKKGCSDSNQKSLLNLMELDKRYINENK